MRTILLSAGFVAYLVGLGGNSYAQECKPESFTIQDVEKIDFSDIAKFSGYSVVEQKNEEQKHQKFGASAQVYGVPFSLSNEDSKSLSNYLLQRSGFDYARDVRSAIVRTALSKTGAAMYKDCLAAQVIKVEIPDAAYTQPKFNLTIMWDPKLAGLPPSVNYEVHVIGGSVEGRPDGVLRGKIKEKDAAIIEIQKLDAVLQIDLKVGGQKYPSIYIPPTRPITSVQYFKRYGTYSPPRNGIGNVCSDHAYLVAELGSAAGPDTKTCRLCVMRSSDGLLLADTAELEGQLIDAATKKQEPVKSGLEMCAVFTAIGRGKNGPRTEVRDGRFYVYEAVRVNAPPQPASVQKFQAGK